ncbi:MAG TPA: DMT family transporter [Candidatus Obscuribacterales bacterium]
MRLIGVLLIVISATSFGAMPIFAHVAYAAGVTPLTALFFRFAIAALCLGAYQVVRQRPLPQIKNLRTLMVMGGLGFVLQSLSFFTALTFATPGVVVLLLYLYPTIVVGISIVVLHQPSSPTKLVALGLALGGTALTIGSIGDTQPIGVCLGLASALVYAIYVLVGERVMQEESPIMACTVMITSAAAVFGGIVALHGVSLPTMAKGWVALGALALVSTVVAIGTLFTGIKLLGAPTAAILSTLEPVVTILLALAILHQPITLPQLAGGTLILTSVMMLATGKELD